MRRGVLYALALLLCLSRPALAEAGPECWTRKAELYYHANARCGGVEGRAPISPEAAAAFDKYACPVCVPVEDGGGDVRAVARGGIIALRFSDAWLAEPEAAGVFGWAEAQEYADADAWSRLGELIHGEAYSDFLAAHSARGSADAAARVPVVLAVQDDLLMNRRHIGCGWYAVVRPAEAFDESWEMYWRIDILNLHMEDGVLSERVAFQTIEESRSVKLSPADGADAAYRRAEGDLEISIYCELGVNIAVIYARGASADLLQDASLRIGGADCGIRMRGYADGARGVFCCALTDGERAALEDGAALSLEALPAGSENASG